MAAGCPPYPPQVVSGDRLLAFAGLALALIVVPGPSVLFGISRGVALGRRAAVTTVVGNAAGVYVQVVAVALGVGALVERSVVVSRMLSLAGAAYLVVLGVRTLRERRTLAAVLPQFADPSVGHVPLATSVATAARSRRTRSPVDVRRRASTSGSRTGLTGWAGVGAQVSSRTAAGRGDGRA